MARTATEETLRTRVDILLSISGPSTITAFARLIEMPEVASWKPRPGSAARRRRTGRPDDGPGAPSSLAEGPCRASMMLLGYWKAPAIDQGQLSASDQQRIAIKALNFSEYATKKCFRRRIVSRRVV